MGICASDEGASYDVDTGDVKVQFQAAEEKKAPAKPVKAAPEPVESVALKAVRMKRREDIFAASVNLDEKYEPPVHEKDEETSKQLTTALQGHFLFTQVDDKDIKTVVDAMEKEVYQPDGVIIQQGACENGARRQFVLPSQNRRRRVRARTVPSRVRSVSSGYLSPLIVGFGSLFSSPLPPLFSLFILSLVGDHGEKATTFYVMTSGASSVYVGTNKVHAYEPGGAFGELALLYSCPRQATIKADEPGTTVYKLDNKTFRYILAHTSKKNNNSSR